MLQTLIDEITPTGFLIISLVVVSSAIWGYFSYEKKQAYPLSAWITITLSVGTAGLSLRLFWRLLTDHELQKLLGLDVLSLALGTIAGIWLSVTTIAGIRQNDP